MSRRYLWWAFPSVVALLGAVLRYHDLSAQVVLDDEWHSLFRAAEEDLVTVATRYARIATSIPLNVFNKILLETWGYSEVSVRILSVIATLATLFLFPWVVLRVFESKRMALTASVLLACSPFWIFYGMSARPYAAYLLLLLVAYHSFYEMLRAPGLRPALIFGLSGALAVYFHLYALPALGAVALLGAWRLVHAARSEGLLAPESRRLLRQGLVGYGLLGGVLAALLLPAALSGVRLPSTREGQFFNEQFAREAVELLTGVRFPALAWLSCAASLFGIVLAVRRNRTFMTILGLGLLGSMAVTLVTRPNFFHVALVTWRYNITIFPLYFVGLAACVDAGVDRASRWIHSRNQSFPVARLELAAIAVFGVLLLLVSPVPRDLSQRPNNFRLHSAYQESYSGWDPSRAYTSAFFGRTIRRNEDEIPVPYARLSEQSEGCRVVEYPFSIGDHQNPFYFYQLHHGCDVIVGYSRDDWMGQKLNAERHERRFRFEHLTNVENIDRLKEKKVDFVMVHLDLEREIRNARSQKPSRETERVVRVLTEKLGEPIARDPWVRLFAVRGGRD